MRRLRRARTHSPCWQRTQRATLKPVPSQSLSNAQDTLPWESSQSVQVNQDSTVDVTLTADDKDGDAISFTVESGPEHGTLTGQLPLLTYTPETGYTGADYFTFTASDGFRTSDVATISITVSQTAIVNTSKPTITGTARVGETLTASAGAWSPVGVAFQYRWLRNGRAISGARSTTCPGGVGRRRQPLSACHRHQAWLHAGRRYVGQHGEGRSWHHPQHEQADRVRPPGRRINPDGLAWSLGTWRCDADIQVAPCTAPGDPRRNRPQVSARQRRPRPQAQRSRDCSESGLHTTTTATSAPTRRIS